MVVLVNGDVERRSTEAARSYVLATRDKLQSEIRRHGAAAAERRSYQRLEFWISPEQLAQMWPYADLELALAD